MSGIRSGVVKILKRNGRHGFQPFIELEDGSVIKEYKKETMWLSYKWAVGNWHFEDDYWGDHLDMAWMTFPEVERFYNNITKESIANKVLKPKTYKTRFTASRKAKKVEKNLNNLINSLEQDAKKLYN